MENEATWEEKVKDPKWVKETLENLTENQVFNFGVVRLYDLLNAKLEQFERERFGELKYNRSEDNAEYARLKNDILDYRVGSAFKLSDNALHSKTIDLSRQIDALYVTREKQTDEKQAGSRNLNDLRYIEATGFVGQERKPLDIRLLCEKGIDTAAPEKRPAKFIARDGAEISIPDITPYLKTEQGAERPLELLQKCGYDVADCTGINKIARLPEPLLLHVFGDQIPEQLSQSQLSNLSVAVQARSVDQLNLIHAEEIEIGAPVREMKRGTN